MADRAIMFAYVGYDAQFLPSDAAADRTWTMFARSQVGGWGYSGTPTLNVVSVPATTSHANVSAAHTLFAHVTSPPSLLA
jgi:hypothetical protein